MASIYLLGDTTAGGTMAGHVSRLLCPSKADAQCLAYGDQVERPRHCAAHVQIWLSYKKRPRAPRQHCPAPKPQARGNSHDRCTRCRHGETRYVDCHAVRAQRHTFGPGIGPAPHLNASRVHRGARAGRDGTAVSGDVPATAA